MPGRALPSTAPSAPLSLDTLAARLVQPDRPADTLWQPPRAPQRLTPHVPGAHPDAPQALVLPITVATCAGCHSVTRSPSHYALVRYSLNSYTFRYSRADTASDDLPREIREHTVTVPFCESCFLAAPSEARSALSSAAEGRSADHHSPSDYVPEIDTLSHNTQA